MMYNTLLFVIFLKITLTQSMNVFDQPNFSAATGVRSGGFPKFPGIYGIDTSNVNIGKKNISLSVKKSSSSGLSDECGTRTIQFYPKRSGKIIGGGIAPYGAFPWQVEIEIFQYEKNAFEHHCGGAVIGELLVLTAAHCTEVNY